MTTDLFAQRLAIAEERLRLLYTEREDHATPTGIPGTAEHSAPLVGHLWPDGRELRRRAADGDTLAHLVTEFALDPEQADLLITCLLPDLEPVCGTAIRMLSGLPTTRPTVAVALAVQGITLSDALTRGLLREGSPLAATGLITYDNPDAAYPDRILHVPDRVLGFLAGDRVHLHGGGRWLHLLPSPAEPAAPKTVARLTSLLNDDPNQAHYLRQGLAGEALPTAHAALTATGRVPLLLDPDALATCDLPPAHLTSAIALEGRLLKAGFLVPVPAPGTTPDSTDLLRRIITRLDAEPVPLLLYGDREWTARQWDTPLPVETDLRPAAQAPEPLCAAALTAVERLHRTAALRSTTVPLETVRRTAHERAAAELGSLARRVNAQVAWSDLVVPTPVRTRLEMLIARVRHRDAVLDSWNLRRGGGRGRGTTALFAGESGTGKTMAAEAVAARLDMDLYIVSLPSVVSKYIGETEKNMERIFSAAETLEAVVLFDEADSMFAKRGEVRGANDRHANMQTGYLLQRLEAFDGLAVLTTNLRSNIDTAFTRRFDEVIEFDSPGPEIRAQLWRTLLGPAAPADAPLDALARTYDLAGGSIRAGVETAAFAAAAHGRGMSRSDLLDGIEAEYRKLGRLFDDPHETGT